jgi:hypothetical protein
MTYMSKCLSERALLSTRILPILKLEEKFKDRVNFTTCFSFRFRNHGRNSIFKPHVLASFYWATILKAVAVLRNGQRRLLIAHNTNLFRRRSSEF